MEDLDNCMICPRECGVNRNAAQKGYCGRSANFEIASICCHMGEEPAISGSKGICNVFFAGCNLRCTYCQNFQISRTNSDCSRTLTLAEIIHKIEFFLNTGIEAVGFVSPSHFAPHVKTIIHQLHTNGYKPIMVYNTNSFDKVEIIKSFEGLIDVYLPDLKYDDKETSLQWSDSSTYPEVSKRAIMEMYRQKGSTLVLDDNNQAVTGLIIRHLVLPGRVSESIQLFEWIARQLSPSVHVSLMSQYYPTEGVMGHPVLGRRVLQEEYNLVVNALEDLGFHKGWIQEFNSSFVYRPDFSNTNPFID